MKKIFYGAFIVVNGLGLVLCATNVMMKSMLEIIYMLEAAGIFLLCCNSFYVPRQMDTVEMLQFKNEMKNDKVLVGPLLFLEVPVVVCFLILYAFV